MMNKTKIAALVGGALLICGAESQAAPTWTFSDSFTKSSGAAGNTSSNTSAGGITATAQAWANTNDGTANDNDGTPNDLGSTSATTAASYKLQTAYLGGYGANGLGVNNLDGTTSSTSGDKGDLANTQPEHAMDNNQRYDSVLFSFSDAVNLTSMTTGYVACSVSPSSCPSNNPADSDFTVWYYNGLGAPSLTGNTYSALGAGWNLLGSYNGGNSTGTTAISNSTGIYSSYWLIGAFNNVADTSSTLSAGNDYFKISGLTGAKCVTNCGGGGSSVPEPGTLLLMGAGLIGLVRTTRRRQVLAA